MDIEWYPSDNDGLTSNWPVLPISPDRRPINKYVIDLPSHTVFTGTIEQCQQHNKHWRGEIREVKIAEEQMQEDERKQRHLRHLGITYRR